jgi:hypothetical protein
MAQAAGCLTRRTREPTARYGNRIAGRIFRVRELKALHFVQHAELQAEPQGPGAEGRDVPHRETQLDFRTAPGSGVNPKCNW